MLFSAAGSLKVTNAGNGALLGYVSANLINNNAQRRFEGFENRLIVSYNTCNTSAFSFNNGQTNFPFLGAVQGRDDVDSTLAPGSYQYLYIADTLFTPPGSTPVGPNADNSYSQAFGNPRTSESSVWSIDANDRVTAQWINPDGSQPPTVRFTQSTALYMGGDQAAFFNRFPAPVTAYDLTFIPE